MHGLLDEMLVSRDQMEQLLGVVVEISADLELETTLRRIITAAMKLTGARYGAVGVRAPDGTLASFLYEGIDDEKRRQIGRLPVGKGVLGLLLNRADPVRLDDLTQHPTAVGFPEHHPPMAAFLGVPITIRGQVFGSLYVTDDRPEWQFSDTDERLAIALASAAAVAIDNAQLYDRARASERWTEAGREITTALLGQTPRKQGLRLIAERLRELTDAEQAIVLVPTVADLPVDAVESLVVSAAVGLHAKEVLGQSVPLHGSTTGAVFRSGIPLITEGFEHPIPAFTDVGQRPAVVMPLKAQDTVIGVIAVARNAQQTPFGSEYLELVSDFANHAALALALATARDHERELTLLADRERIAHDLHDHVIQRLFAAGMSLQATIARVHTPDVASRLSHTVDELQSTITDIRTAIFNLQSPFAGDDFRQRIQTAVAELTDHSGVRTRLMMSGPLAAITAELSDHAEAVLTEAVSNAVRHSGGSTLSIEVAVADELTIVVTDNGRGIDPEVTRRSGLANLTRRAGLVGGRCDIRPAQDGGTMVRWIAPITED
jgi:signal transduction histidine kinase